MTDTTQCKALRSFTQFVSGYGQVHGDPDSKDNKKPDVPNSAIDLLVGEDKIAKPKGWITDAERKEAKEQAIQDALEKQRLNAESLPYADREVYDLIKLATELEVMPAQGTGSGKDGNVVKSDVVAALEQADADSAPA